MVRILCNLYNMLFWIYVGMMLRQETLRPHGCRLTPEDLSRSLPRLVTRQSEIMVNTENILDVNI